MDPAAELAKFGLTAGAPGPVREAVYNVARQALRDRLAGLPGAERTAVLREMAELEKTVGAIERALLHPPAPPATARPPLTPAPTPFASPPLQAPLAALEEVPGWRVRRVLYRGNPLFKVSWLFRGRPQEETLYAEAEIESLRRELAAQPRAAGAGARVGA